MLKRDWLHPLSCAALPGSVRKATLPGSAAQPHKQISPQYIPNAIREGPVPFSRANVRATTFD